MTASNDLAGGDPAQDVVKEMRVEYEYSGQKHLASVAENQTLTLPPPGAAAGGNLRVLRAAYGKFHEVTRGGLPELKAVDVTAKLAALVQDGTLNLVANNDVAGGDPCYGVPKDLRVEYAVDGATRTVTVPENAEVRLPEDAWNSAPPAPRLSAAGGGLRLLAWEGGRYSVTNASGATKTVDVPATPEPVEVAGPWDIGFQPGRGAPDIKYFSGTATYRTAFELPAGAVRGPQSALLLDLGQVKVIAEVKLNGKDLGIVWKTPYRVDITGAAKAGRNELEVRITNLWPNRLIGDEQYPDDCEWRGITIARWPDWMVKGEPRPVKERVTFTTWKHWHKNSPLLPSGLIGPVTVQAGVWVEVK